MLSPEQELYLEYIQRRLATRKSPLEAPPIPYLVFRKMWDDRVKAIEENKLDLLEALNTLLEIGNDYDEDGRSFTRLIAPVQPQVEYGWDDEYGFL
jgi:hypothetical protein